MSSVLWFQAGACSGNTMSFLNAEEPNVVDLIVDFGLELLWHPSLGMELGDQAKKIFTDCASGLRWPIAMTADYLALERAYSRARTAPSEPVLVSFDGRLAVMPGMEGPPREHMVVQAFAAAEPGRRCHPPEGPQATLTNTYWKLTVLAGARITSQSEQTREVRITLDGGATRMHGFSGCNALQG